MSRRARRSVITVDGQINTHQCAAQPILSPCIFEFVYFARPDSIIDNISVHKARSRMGKKLAAKIKREWSNHDIDVVIPIPDTSRTAALQLANQLGIPYSEGFIKNRYIGRTFIMPGQQVRKKSVRQKLNAIDLEFRKKNVLLVDDSIVRGTTSQQIIQMARDAGAHRVYFASAAPPVRFPNVYGIDMPAASELIAHGRSEEEVARELGADRLDLSELGDLIDAVQKKGKSHVDRFDTSVFDGLYVTGDVTPNTSRRSRRTATMSPRPPTAPSARTSLTSITRPEGPATADAPVSETPIPAESGFATRAVRIGHHRTPEGEHGEPIFTTSSFVFASAAEAAARFSGDQAG
jgi:glutamine phosphoribosylpyrophosphate amidotransferase